MSKGQLNPVVIFGIIATVFLAGCVDQYAPPEGTAPTPVPTPTPPAEPAPSPEAIPTIKEFKITIDHNNGYSPNKISVSKGDTVKILAISNQPLHNHGLTIDAYNVNMVVLKNSFTDPDVLEFVADKEGTFEMYCKMCLDGPQGAHPWMVGTLEIK